VDVRYFEETVIDETNLYTSVEAAE
jgi:hypothetical protein